MLTARCQEVAYGTPAHYTLAAAETPAPHRQLVGSHASPPGHRDDKVYHNLQTTEKDNSSGTPSTLSLDL